MPPHIKTLFVFLGIIVVIVVALMALNKHDQREENTIE